MLLAAGLALAIAMVALRLRALAPSGAIVAVLMGTIVVAAGGWWSGIVLVVFFGSSSLVSQINRQSTILQARGSRRDGVQVLANGWGMVAGTLLYSITDWRPWLLFGMGAIAAATADTWSSEIGRTSAAPPRLVTTWQRVPRGSSGAVSARGLLASVAGGTLIAVLAAIGLWQSSSEFSTNVPLIIALVALAGFLGALVDSYLGAVVQEQRFCDVCNGRTEANPHTCGNPTRHVSGMRGFNNDVVNFLCVLTGALIGLFSGIL